MTELITVGLMGAYGAMALYTTRFSYRLQYQLWMDREIRKHMAWVEKNPARARVAERPEALRARMKDSWNRNRSQDAFILAALYGVVWPLSWVLHWMTHDPAPSKEERRLMDAEAHARLEELERQAGLRPLDE